MYFDFWEYVTFVGLAVLMAIACLLLGIMPVLFMEAGAATLFWIGAVLAVCMGIGNAFLADLVFEDNWKAKVIVGIVAAIITFYPTGDTLYSGSDDAAQMRSLSPAISQYGLAHFTAMDTDHDGTITEEELEHYQASQDNSGNDARLIAQTIAHLSDIGHVTSETTVMIPLTTVVNNVVTVTMSPSTTYTYGINKQDLESYPQRTVEKYRNW